MIKQYGVDCYGVAVGALGDERGLIVSAVYRRCGSQKTAAGRSRRDQFENSSNALSPPVQPDLGYLYQLRLSLT